MLKQCSRCFHDIEETAGVKNYIWKDGKFRHMNTCPAFAAKMNHCDWCDTYGHFGYTLFWVDPWLLCRKGGCALKGHYLRLMGESSRKVGSLETK